MKNYFLKKEITAVAFIMILFIFSIFNIVVNFSVIKAAVLADEKPENGESITTLSAYIDNLDSTVNETIIGRYVFIEGYGVFHKLLGKKEENSFEIVKSDDGILYDNLLFSNTVKGDMNYSIDATRTLNEISEKAGAEFLVTMPPGKTMVNGVEQGSGYPNNYYMENTDYYLKNLEQSGIEYVDLRDSLFGLGWDMDELFYKTDHHWTTQASFQAFQTITKEMEQKYSVSLDPSHYYTDAANYNFITYLDQYLGSSGRKTGAVFSGGLDDFVLIYPKFKTDFSFSAEQFGNLDHFSQRGRMEDALIDISVLNADKNMYETDYYGTYMYGVTYPFATIKNELNPNGPKVLLIRDSYACAPMTFFSSVCSWMDVMYPLYYEDNTRKLIENGNYDYVILMSYPGNFGRYFYNMQF